MSQVTYNGITLPYALTTKFEQRALYDPDGRTDWFVQQFDLGFQAVINASYLALVAPDLTGPAGPGTDNAGFIMSVIRSRLLKPRQTLSVQFNGKELIPQVQQGNKGKVDALNGPQPQACSIIQLNNVTFLIHFHIVAHYWENSELSADNNEGDITKTNLPGNTVLYNRWSETAALDDVQLTTYTRTGRILIRSDNAKGFIADQVRDQMIVTQPATGFLRRQSQYTVDPSGLGLAYTVTDQEVFKLPPDGAFSAEGYYAEHGTAGYAIRVAECYVKLRGAKKKGSQEKLVQNCVDIVTTKLDINGANASFSLEDSPNEKSIIEASLLRIDMYNNVVEFMAKAVRTADRTNYDGLGFTTNALTLTPLSDPGNGFGGAVPPLYNVYGTAGFQQGDLGLLKAAAYYDPSLTETVVQDFNRQLSKGKQPGTVGKEGE